MKLLRLSLIMIATSFVFALNAQGLVIEDKIISEIIIGGTCEKQIHHVDGTYFIKGSNGWNAWTYPSPNSTSAFTFDDGSILICNERTITVVNDGCAKNAHRLINDHMNPVTRKSLWDTDPQPQNCGKSACNNLDFSAYQRLADAMLDKGESYWASDDKVESIVIDYDRLTMSIRLNQSPGSKCGSSGCWINGAILEVPEK